VEAAVAAGLAANPDFNGPAQDGVGYYQVTQREGRRWSAADAYLRPAMRRGNLTVETDALATRVLIQDGRAVGVAYLRQGTEHQARAGREVLLCGGAVNSPQLLLLSGVGPAGHLREHGIQVQVDTPKVGDGLQDHPTCFVVWGTPTIPHPLEEATPGNLDLWRRERRGPMASHGVEAGGFARSHDALAAPDLQFGVAGGPPPLPELGETTRRVASMIVVAVDVRSRGPSQAALGDPRAKAAIGDRGRRQPRVAEPGLHEGVDALPQGPLPGRRRQLGGPVQPGRQSDADQVEHGTAEPGPVARAPVAQARTSWRASEETRAPAPWSPGNRTADSSATSSGRNGSNARGNTTATSRIADMDQWAGRDRSTRVKSPGPSTASRPSWVTTPRPRTSRSTLHTSRSSRRTCLAVRLAPPGWQAISSATRTAPASPTRSTMLMTTTPEQVSASTPPYRRSRSPAGPRAAGEPGR
jgi:hypothetical protein